MYCAALNMEEGSAVLSPFFIHFFLSDSAEGGGDVGRGMGSVILPGFTDHRKSERERPTFDPHSIM